MEHISTDVAVTVNTAKRVMPQTFEQMRALPDKVLTDLIDALLETDLFQTVETGRLSISDGSEKAAVYARMQYLPQELVRREQDKQTKEMISQTKVMIREARCVSICTIAIGIMTLVVMFATIWSMAHPH